MNLIEARYTIALNTLKLLNHYSSFTVRVILENACEKAGYPISIGFTLDVIEAIPDAGVPAVEAYVTKALTEEQESPKFPYESQILKISDAGSKIAIREDLLPKSNSYICLIVGDGARVIIHTNTRKIVEISTPETDKFISKSSTLLCELGHCEYYETLRTLTDKQISNLKNTLLSASQTTDDLENIDKLIETIKDCKEDYEYYTRGLDNFEEILNQQPKYWLFDRFSNSCEYPRDFLAHC
ncbi:hypothetical protein [Pseudomonas sp. NY15374]|uniref:hypothetical protein n=1 Tax=Pseudomonas sp. NY15374 TaxID=3400357 RepID=UPI003A83CC17